MFVSHTACSTVDKLIFVCRVMHGSANAQALSDIVRQTRYLQTHRVPSHLKKMPADEFNKKLEEVSSQVRCLGFHGFCCPTNALLNGKKKWRCNTCYSLRAESEDKAITKVRFPQSHADVSVPLMAFVHTAVRMEGDGRESVASERKPSWVHFRIRNCKLPKEDVMKLRDGAAANKESRAYFKKLCNRKLSKEEIGIRKLDAALSNLECESGVALRVPEEENLDKTSTEASEQWLQTEPAALKARDNWM